MPDHIHLLPSILSPTTSYPIAGMSRSQISHRLPPISFALNMHRKLQLPIPPYECKYQCNVYDIYGDHPFNCPKNHKGQPHNMISNKFSQALAPLLTTANIISPTTNLDKETNLHLPADPTARPFNVSYKPNIDCLPSNVFSMIGYDITITNATPPLPTNHDPPSSLDCITN